MSDVLHLTLPPPPHAQPREAQGEEREGGWFWHRCRSARQFRVDAGDSSTRNSEASVFIQKRLWPALNRRENGAIARYRQRT
jgi:hypothetical protein